MVEHGSNISELEMRLEQTSEYVASNIFAAKDGRRCVDGRYDQHVDKYTGMLSRPGGDFGYVMALMGVNADKNLGLTPQECFELVYEAVTRNGDSFYMHTDHHADPTESTLEDTPDHPLIGCGHAAKPTNSELAALYGLDAEAMKEVVGIAKQASAQDEKIVLVNLPGDHKEKGVITVSDSRYSVRSQDGDTMYFIYDILRDEEYLSNLVDELNIDGLTLEDVKAMSDKQLGATLQLLANGLPIYNVSGDPLNPHVTAVGQV